MVGKWAVAAALAAAMMTLTREAQAQRPATIGVSATVLAFARPDTLRTPPPALPARFALPAPADTDRVRARRPRLVVAYTGV